MAEYLIYGATGYTGGLIAREAVRRGQRPVLAGRNGPALATLARELGVEHRVFALEDAEVLDAGLRGVKVVLHCAGPFAHTALPMAAACVREGVHYLDITGEEEVFAVLAQGDHDVRAAGVMLMPGVGFDVVPSDCLAAHLKRRLPSATRLALGFQVWTRMSRGTTLTVIENLGEAGGLVRQEGELKRVPAAWKTRVIDFGAGPVTAMTIPWGDLVTAYHSTGIPNIEVYMAAPRGARLAARLSRHLGWLLGASPVQRLLARWARSGAPGPSEQERRQGRSLLWGEATDDAGRCVVSRLSGAESYTLTVQAALAVVDRVLAGHAPPGFQTPAMAYGPDFVLELDGVTRTDEPESKSM